MAVAIYICLPLPYVDQRKEIESSNNIMLENEFFCYFLFTCCPNFFRKAFFKIKNLNSVNNTLFNIDFSMHFISLIFNINFFNVIFLIG